MTIRPDIAIFGSGAWGTALAISWARQGAKVALWGHPAELVATLARERRHPALPGAELPPGIRLLSSPEEAFRGPLWISALPTQINPVVWRDLAERQRQVLVGSQLLKVDGRWEREGEVRHLIAGRLSDLSPLLNGISVQSRDFR